MPTLYHANGILQTGGFQVDASETELLGTAGWSCLAWVWRDREKNNAGQITPILQFNDGSGGGGGMFFGLAAGSNGEAAMSLNRDTTASAFDVLETTSLILFNHWCLMGFTHDGDPSHKPTAYNWSPKSNRWVINTAPYENSSGSGTFKNVTTKLWIAHSTYWGWPGALAHIQLWNRKLSDGEMFRAASVPGSVRDNLTLWLPLDRGRMEDKGPLRRHGRIEDVSGFYHLPKRAPTTSDGSGFGRIPKLPLMAAHYAWQKQAAAAFDPAPVAAKTTRTVTVKPTGGDYTSLRAAILGEAAGVFKNLVTSNIDLVIECYTGVTDTTRITAADWTGFVTDSNHTITAQAAAGHRSATGKWDATKWYVAPPSGGYGVAPVQVPMHLHVTFKWLQLDSLTPLSNRALGIELKNVAGVGGSLTVGDGSVIRNIQSTATPDGSEGVTRASGGPHTLILQNCVIDGFGTPIYDGVYAPGQPLTVRIYNATFVNFVTQGLTNAHDTGGTHDVANVILQGSGVHYNYGGSGTFRKRSVLTKDGTGDIPNVTLTFVDKANGDYRLSASDVEAIGTGVRLAPSNPDGAPTGFTTDALGLRR